jgi:hypothetical protein
MVVVWPCNADPPDGEVIAEEGGEVEDATAVPAPGRQAIAKNNDTVNNLICMLKIYQNCRH